ncbi:MAG TPA: hypothetical protein VHY20_06045, partial [Pirellulales bacterium]|nr:hypothetical protein [Pirellulales bacterium]
MTLNEHVLDGADWWPTGMATSITARQETESPHSPPSDQLPLPENSSRRRILWSYLIGVTGVHVLALFALLPWLFSWPGVAVALAGVYVFGTLGINTCYHRLLT